MTAELRWRPSTRSAETPPLHSRRMSCGLVLSRGSGTRAYVTTTALAETVSSQLNRTTKAAGFGEPSGRNTPGMYCVQPAQSGADGSAEMPSEGLGRPVVGSMPPDDCASRTRNVEINPVSAESPTESVVDLATLSDVINAATTTPAIKELSTMAITISMSVNPVSGCRPRPRMAGD